MLQTIPLKIKTKIGLYVINSPIEYRTIANKFCVGKSNEFSILKLFIYYNTITNYILIIYEVGNYDHVWTCVEPQVRISGGNQTSDPHANSLKLPPLPTKLPRHSILKLI